MKKTTFKGIEQGRAEFAFDCAKEGVKENPKYKSYVKKVPAMIQTNGLGATLAFILSKSDETTEEGKAYRLIYNKIKEWLLKSPIRDEIVINEEDELVQHIISLSSHQYRIATMEVLAFFHWLRRFAEGLDQSN